MTAALRTVLRGPLWLTALLDRLDDERRVIESLERQLAAARRRRQLLMVKASRAGLSTREIGAHAGISSPGVSQSVRSWQPESAP